MLGSVFVLVLSFVLNSVPNVHSFSSDRINDRVVSSNINSSAIAESLGFTQSQATATGLGSTVEVNGILTGGIGSLTSAQSSNPSQSATSDITSQLNCSDYSGGSAEGADTATVLASGNCTTNLANSGVHTQEVSDAGKAALVMEGYVVHQGNANDAENATTPTGLASQGAHISQTTSHNVADGSLNAYQLVNGPLAASLFTGLGMFGHEQDDQFILGSNEFNFSSSQPVAVDLNEMIETEILELENE